MDLAESTQIGDLLDHVPVPTLIIDRLGDVTWVNRAVRELGALGLERRRATDEGPIGFAGLFACDDAGTIGDTASALADRPSGCSATIATVVADTRAPVDLHLAATGDGRVIAQIVETSGSVRSASLEQHRAFRTAVLELGELSHRRVDESEFYDAFVRRAVASVPGAQAGSILVKRPGTDEFHFAAASGFDLVALQQHHLETVQMFGDLETPVATVSHDIRKEDIDPDTAEWLRVHGRIDEIVSNVAVPVFVDGEAVAFVSLDSFDDRDAFDSTSIEMTTVLGRLIADLIRRRRLEAELLAERESFRHLAHHDGLTGLANRRHLEATILDTIAESNRTRQPMAVLFIDLDDFKLVNDTLGHDAGDRVLVAVADTLKLASRGGDIVGRWGGDEFVLVAPGMPTRSDAHRLAQRVIEMLGEELPLDDGRAVRCNMSIGVAWSRDGSEGFHTILRRADDALYRAKLEGKATVRTDAA